MEKQMYRYSHTIFDIHLNSVTSLSERNALRALFKSHRLFHPIDAVGKKIPGSVRPLKVIEAAVMRIPGAICLRAKNGSGIDKDQTSPLYFIPRSRDSLFRRNVVIPFGTLEFKERWNEDKRTCV